MRVVFRASDPHHFLPEPLAVDGCALSSWGEATSHTNDQGYSLSDFGVDVGLLQDARPLYAATFACSCGAMDSRDGRVTTRLRHIGGDVQVVKALGLVRGVRDAATTTDATTTMCMSHARQPLRLGMSNDGTSTGEASSTTGQRSNNATLTNSDSQFELQEPSGGGNRQVLGQLTDVDRFAGPLPSDDPRPISPSTAAAMVDWTVSLEMNPLGVGCHPHATGFPGRHEANYAAMGHVERQAHRLSQEDWKRMGVRSPGCVRFTAVPKSNSTGYSERTDFSQALEALVIPSGRVVVPNGGQLILEKASSATHETSDWMGHPAFEPVGRGKNSTAQIGWGIGDLFGASFAMLPASLSGSYRAPLGDGAPNARRDPKSISPEILELVGGEMVSLVRPPPVRVYSKRIVVGAPRAWAATGRVGALAVVDFAVDLLDRPIVIDAAGN